MLSLLLITFMLFTNMMFMYLHHPLAITLLIVLQTIMICINIGSFSYSFWFSYILFLIFLGGMLVLFIYITSLASNEMFSFPIKIMLISFSMSLMMFMITMYFSNIMFHLINKQDTLIIKMMETYPEMPNNLTQLYNYPNMNLTIMSILYLLLTLIIIVKITQIHEGPLRQLS